MNCLVLTGKRGVGKTSIGRIFERQLGYRHIEMSTYIDDIKAGTSYKNITLRRYVELTHKVNGKDYFLKKVCSDFKPTNNYILTGVRHPEELEFLKQLSDCDQVYFVYVYAGVITRLIRTLKREKRNSILQFVVEEYYSIKWGDGKIRNLCVVIDTSALSLLDVFNKISKLMQ